MELWGDDQGTTETGGLAQQEKAELGRDGREMTETDGLREQEKAEMRRGGCETTGNGGSGEREEKGVKMNRGEEVDDGDWTDGSADRERRGGWSHLHGPEYCSACQGNPFACGCLDVSFESRGEKMLERERQARWPDQCWGYSGVRQG